MGTSKNLTTGYGKLGKYLFDGLKKDYEVFYFGLQYIGLQNKNVLPIGNQIYGSDVLATYILENKIDILITFVDMFDPNFAYINDVVRDTKVKWIQNITINTSPISRMLLENSRASTLLVSPSKFGSEELEKKQIKSKTIYHGVNTKIFKPKKSKPKDIEGKFVFLGVGVNKYNQKNWIDLFRAYKVFMEKYDIKNSILLLVTEAISPDGIELEKIAMELGIGNSVSFINVVRNIGLNEKSMAKVYNLSDCYVSSSLGESFGLPLIESMACGLPCVVTGFSALKEHIENSNGGLSVENRAMFPTLLATDQALIDINDFADKMYKIYSDEVLRKELSRNAIEYANKYDWKVIIGEWKKAIEEISKPSLSYDTYQWGI